MNRFLIFTLLMVTTGVFTKEIHHLLWVESPVSALKMAAEKARKTDNVHAMFMEKEKVQSEKEERQLMKTKTTKAVGRRIVEGITVKKKTTKTVSQSMAEIFPKRATYWDKTYLHTRLDAVGKEVGSPDIVGLGLKESDKATMTMRNTLIKAEITTEDKWKERRMSWPPPGLYPVLETLVNTYHPGCALLQRCTYRSLDEDLRVVRTARALALVSTAAAGAEAAGRAGSADEAENKQGPCQHRKPLRVFTCQPGKARAFIAQRWSSSPELASGALWLLPALHSSDLSPAKLLANVYVPFDCELWIARPRPQTTLPDGASQDIKDTTRSPGYPMKELSHGVLLEEAWRAAPGWPLHVRKGPPEAPLLQRRKDPEGAHLRVIALHSPPYEIAKKLPNGKLFIAGFAFNLWKAIIAGLNFSVEYKISSGIASGAQLPNGSWSGAIGYLQRGDAEVAFHTFTQTPVRMRAAAFLPPVMASRTKMFVPAGQKSVRWGAFLSPFSYTLWAAVAAAVGAAAIMLFLARLFVSGPSTQPPVKWPFFMALGLFCMQDIKEMRRTTYILAYFLYPTYHGLCYTIIMNEHQESKDPDMVEIYNRFVKGKEDRLPTTIFEAFDKVCKNSREAIMTSEAAVKAFTVRDMVCPLVAVPKDSFQETLALAVNKYCPFRRLLAYRIQTLRRSGQLAHHFTRTTLATGPKAVVAKEAASDKQLTAVFRSAELLDTAAAAVAMAAGAAAAAVIAVAEKLLKHVARTRETQTEEDHRTPRIKQIRFMH